jgi:hypothetical protein
VKRVARLPSAADLRLVSDVHPNDNGMHLCHPGRWWRGSVLNKPRARWPSRTRRHPARTGPLAPVRWGMALDALVIAQTMRALAEVFLNDQIALPTLNNVLHAKLFVALRDEEL